MPKAAKFKYTKGRATTDTPWFRPDPNQMNLWKKEVFDTIDLKGLTLWIFGGAIQGIRTWDIDMCLTGPAIETSKLRDILDQMVQIGFKYRQLVDVSYSSLLTTDFRELNDYTHPNFLNPREESLTKAFQIIEKNGEITRVFDGFVEGTSVGESMWEFTSQHPTPKVIKKHQEKAHPYPPFTLHPDTDFRDYIRWP